MTETKSRWSILITILMSTFMATLDSSIVNVALPEMANVLNVTTSNIQLVATSYLIVIVGTVLIFGRLGDMFGKTRVFKFGVTLFTIGSLLCGITHSFPMLIIARIIQAIGAAGTMSTNQGIITEVFPQKERGKALGLLGTSVALGSLVGPGLGGLIVGVVSWEFIFLINVPIGIVTLYLAFKLLPKGYKTAGGKMDGTGSILFVISMVSLFAALNNGINVGFTAPIIIIGFTVAILSFLTFLFVEMKRDNPLIKLEIFKNKLFSLSILCGFISFVAIFCNNIILPFYLQDVMAYTPGYAGLILMVYPLVLTVVAPISGHLSDKIGSEILTFIGLVLISIGLLFMSTLNENATVLRMLSFISIMSFGMGMFQSPNNSLVMSTVSKDKLGVAGSINALVRNMGMVSGIALATTLLYSRMSAKIGYRVTDYVEGRNDVFIYGMKTVYVVAAIICFAATILTLIRLIAKKKPAS